VNHHQPFTRSERIGLCVAVLRTANDDYEFIDFFQNGLHCVEMTQVKGLKSSNIQSAFNQ
jgi:hypothetical protein